jgi:periplasmic protein TonB
MKALLALALLALVGVQDSTIYTPGNGVTLPQVVKQVKPDYTEEARRNRIEGTVGLDVVVLADGTIGDVTVARSLDTIYGLDANAVKAMKQWQFKPGMKEGKPVTVRVAIDINYSLR